MFFKYFIININKCLKPFFSRTVFHIVNTVKHQSFFVYLQLLSMQWLSHLLSAIGLKHNTFDIHDMYAG